VDFSGTRWVARSNNRGWLEANQDLLHREKERVNGKWCAPPGLLWTQGFARANASDFESKIISCLPANIQHDGATLFLLLEQCFQEVILNKWKNVVSAGCPDKDAKTSKTSSNVNEIILMH
jgi:hypothetical protein